jgi:site-specific DNA recombinase
VSFGEAILTPGEHARVLAELERRRTIVRSSSLVKWIGRETGSGRPARYLLAGLATCASCGYGMVGHNRPERGYVVYRCSTFINGYACKARAHIRAEIAEAEVRRQLTARLAAMEPGDPVLMAVAERWRKLTMTGDEGERADLESRLAAVRDRVIDLEEARYVRGEFKTPDEVARWDTMMGRLKVQRDAVVGALEELGPPSDFDLGLLLDSHLSREAWDAAPLAHKRQLLEVATDRIIIGPAHRQRKLSPSDRVRILLAGEGAEDDGPVVAEERALGRWARTIRRRARGTLPAARDFRESLTE